MTTRPDRRTDRRSRGFNRAVSRKALARDAARFDRKRSTSYNVKAV